MHLLALSLGEAASLLRSGKVSPVELTRACLQRIEQLGPRLDAFITVTADSALVEAGAAEAEIRRGLYRGPLHGIPIALKDLLDTAGVRTTGGSALFRDRVPGHDAEVVRRLKAAGAVLLGNLNLHELAYGASAVTTGPPDGSSRPSTCWPRPPRPCRRPGSPSCWPTWTASGRRSWR